MTHQTGIRASRELVSLFTDASPNIRCVVVKIENETFVSKLTILKSSTFKQDFTLLEKQVEANFPAFYLYKQDHPSDWIFIEYIPEIAHIREKMLYSASKSALLKDLGGENRFSDKIYMTFKSEVSLKGYEDYLRHKNVENPLTEREKELAKIKMEENGADIGISSRKTHMSGLSFQVSNETEQAIRQILSDGQDGALVSFQVQNECLELKSKFQVNSSVKEAKNSVNDSEPHFVLFVHGTELVFAYICPPKAPIKVKMLYSSSKAQLVQVIEEQMKEYRASSLKKVEVDDLEEFDEELKSIPKHGSHSVLNSNSSSNYQNINGTSNNNNSGPISFAISPVSFTPLEGAKFARPSRPTRRIP